MVALIKTTKVVVDKFLEKESELSPRFKRSIGGGSSYLPRRVSISELRASTSHSALLDYIADLRFNHNFFGSVI